MKRSFIKSRDVSSRSKGCNKGHLLGRESLREEISIGLLCRYYGPGFSHRHRR